MRKTVSAIDLLASASARLEGEQERPVGRFAPDFTNAEPLESLGLAPREAEVLPDVPTNSHQAKD